MIDSIEDPGEHYMDKFLRECSTKGEDQGSGKFIAVDLPTSDGGRGEFTVEARFIFTALGFEYPGDAEYEKACLKAVSLQHDYELWLEWEDSTKTEIKRVETPMDSKCAECNCDVSPEPGATWAFVKGTWNPICLSCYGRITLRNNGNNLDPYEDNDTPF